MNIGFVLSYLDDRFGGPVAAARGLGGSLAALGHDVSYWATTGADRSSRPVSTEDVHVYEVNRPRSWCRSREFARGLSAAVRSLDVLELNEFWLYPVFAGSRIAARAGIPYVLRPAGSLQSWALQRSRLKQIKKALYRRLAGDPIVRRAACIRAASMHEVENIRRLGYRGPIAVVPNGVSTEELDGVEAAEAESTWPGLKNRPTVVFMSRLSQEKGLDLLIPAWAELVSCTAYKDAVLVIAGPDYRGYQKVVTGMIEKHGLREAVLMPGMVRGRKKASLLRRADVFVLPSYSENFGIVIAEALACGVPVITTTGTPWEHLHRIDAGRWILPSRAGLVEALREMLSMSASSRMAMGCRGSSFVRSEYGWSNIACMFLRLCGCILQGKAIPLHP